MYYYTYVEQLLQVEIPNNIGIRYYVNYLLFTSFFLWSRLKFANWSYESSRTVGTYGTIRTLFEYLRLKLKNDTTYEGI